MSVFHITMWVPLEARIKLWNPWNLNTRSGPIEVASVYS